jgi:hypothetical protein
MAANIVAYVGKKKHPSTAGNIAINVGASNPSPKGDMHQGATVAGVVSPFKGRQRPEIGFNT